jgi:TNF receptor-associated protein 1
VTLFSCVLLELFQAEGLLPPWLRFVYGVVDSEDVPLSVSREHLQDQKVIQRISNVVTKRLLKEFKVFLLFCLFVFNFPQNRI